jgi:hypothetical protein
MKVINKTMISGTSVYLLSEGMWNHQPSALNANAVISTFAIDTLYCPYFIFELSVPCKILYFYNHPQSLLQNLCELTLNYLQQRKNVHGIYMVALTIMLGICVLSQTKQTGWPLKR